MFKFVLRLVVPDKLSLVFEGLLALVLVGIYTFGDVSSNLQKASRVSTSPADFFEQQFRSLLGLIDKFEHAPTIVTFLLWAFFGIIVYTIVYEVAVAIMGTRDAVKAAVEYEQPKWVKTSGAIASWLRSVALGVIRYGLACVAFVVVLTVVLPYSAVLVRAAFDTSGVGMATSLLAAYAVGFACVRISSLALLAVSAKYRRWYME